MKALELAAITGKRSLTLLIVVSLSLLSASCTSKIQCQPPNVTPWMLESQPLNIELTEQVFSALSELQLEPNNSTESAVTD